MRDQREGQSVLPSADFLPREFADHTAGAGGINLKPSRVKIDPKWQLHGYIGLEVNLIAPSNATGYKFDFDFYSFEYPEWVCTTFNDQFMALVNPAPMGSLDGNISIPSAPGPERMRRRMRRIAYLQRWEKLFTSRPAAPIPWQDSDQNRGCGWRFFKIS